MGSCDLALLPGTSYPGQTFPPVYLGIHTHTQLDINKSLIERYQYLSWELILKSFLIVFPCLNLEGDPFLSGSMHLSLVHLL